MPLKPAGSGTPADPNKEAISSKQKEVDQLRREEAVERVPVSETGRDLMQYCQDNRQDDPQLNGVTGTSANPFQEKRTCTIL